MKKMYKKAVVFLIYGIISGMFYHEVQYYSHFEGYSVLENVHTHTMVLGTVVFTLIPVFMKLFNVQDSKYFNKSIKFYESGLWLSTIMTTIIGLFQLYSMSMNKFFDHMTGGLDGIGHVLMAVGLYYMFKILFEKAEN